MTLEEIKKMFGGVVEIYNNGEYVIGEEKKIFSDNKYYNCSKLFEKIVNSDKFIEIKTKNGEDILILEDSPLFDETSECSWLHCIINPAHHEDDEQFYIVGYKNKLIPIGPVCKNIELK